MSEEPQPSSSRLEFPSHWLPVIVLGILGGFAVLALQPTNCTEYEKPKITNCKNKLKQLGLSLISYYSDGTSTALPVLKSFEVSVANNSGFGFDANMLSCPAMHHGPCLDYVWNPKLSGGKWADWNNPNSPLIWDATPHKLNGKLNVLMGDGFVKELTPEQLKELTR
ncbi:MAG: hypothetical protein RL095_1928 [Verrucomicrobiota bacterium]|jgi:hypothetical protein